jgi:gluconolactonase
MRNSLAPRSLAVVLLVCSLCYCADDYPLRPDSQPHDNIPHGKVEKFTFKESKLYPGSTHDYWVYIPAQYDAQTPAALMVFQDGAGYQDPKGAWRVPVVFDNLIAKKEMPITIAVMVDHGKVYPPQNQGQDRKSEPLPRFLRSYEYDSPTDLYARFLTEELLPEVAKKWDLTKDPNQRAICGSSSGGICAFTVAWERPNEFRKVLSTIGSFANLKGGETYADLVRKTEPKPLRVFQQDGSNDLNIYAGSWYIGNQDLHAALEFAGYDCKFVVGDGGHTARHGGSIFPDALRWLWRSDKFTPPANIKTPALEIISLDQGWEVVSEGHKFADGPAADKQGNIFFSDIPNNRIHKIDAEGKVSIFAENTNSAAGLMFGPDGKLYAAAKNQVVAYTPDGKSSVVADNVEGNDLCITHAGGIYVTVPSKKEAVYLAKGAKEPKVVAERIEEPNGIILTPDQSQVIVSDTKSPFLCIFTIQPDGTLTNRMPYFTVQMPFDKADSGLDGLTVDKEGRLYACTHMGIQIFDQAGRVNAILPKPQPGKWLGNICFGGKDMSYIYIAHADKVYRRHTKTTGVLSADAPVIPPAPRL